MYYCGTSYLVRCTSYIVLVPRTCVRVRCTFVLTTLYTICGRYKSVLCCVSLARAYCIVQGTMYIVRVQGSATIYPCDVHRYSYTYLYMVLIHTTTATLRCSTLVQLLALPSFLPALLHRGMQTYAAALERGGRDARRGPRLCTRLLVQAHTSVQGTRYYVLVLCTCTE